VWKGGYKVARPLLYRCYFYRPGGGEVKGVIVHSRMKEWTIMAGRHVPGTPARVTSFPGEGEEDFRKRVEAYLKNWLLTQQLKNK